ncbi:hypothetical protein [Legionella spiritensis]|uniref:Uncharacterized protein n=1 Tax=Legionella spiritensis TaxID=452 RepID=A0A0W0Z419_LEGSP|nr:hypothetical protein [Legionella spiritensis]KTD63888.1 hypothetical protein Lspi_1407 [Legionella spiritensis]SNV36278.1 Uncharacterised protein [Legionella spiritensis]
MPKHLINIVEYTSESYTHIASDEYPSESEASAAFEASKIKYNAKDDPQKPYSGLFGYPTFFRSASNKQHDKTIEIRQTTFKY